MQSLGQYILDITKLQVNFWFSTTK